MTHKVIFIGINTQSFFVLLKERRGEGVLQVISTCNASPFLGKLHVFTGDSSYSSVSLAILRSTLRISPLDQSLQKKFFFLKSQIANI